MADTWDISHTTINETTPIYSNDDRTASIGANGVSYVQNIQPKIYGKWYVELSVTYIGNAADHYRVGVVSNFSAVSYDFSTILLGEDNRSIGWTAKGNVTINDYVSNAYPYSSGDTVCIACDFDINKIWFRTNNGVWSDEENSANSVSDPALQTGGLDIFGLAGDQKRIGVMLSSNSSVTIAPLQYTPPNGFSPWINLLPMDFLTANAALSPLTAYGVAFSGGYTLNTPTSGVSLDSLLMASSDVYSFNPYDIIFPVDFYGAGARVNMFDIPQVIHLVLPDSYIDVPVLMNYPINRTDFRLIRGVPNVIQFFVRDVDRHIAAGPLANAVLKINVVDTNTETVLMQRDLFVVNAATSLYGWSTQPVEVLNWPTGALIYSIMVTRSDGTQGLLWTDRNYSPYGYFQMTDGPLPGPVVPTLLDPTTFVIDTGYSYSTAVPGAAAKGYPDGLQTFTFYTTNYTGNCAIQGSLVSQPTTDMDDWFAIQYHQFNMTNGVTAINVVGNYLWLRAAVQVNELVPYPGVPILPLTNGTVDKILYLN